MLAILKLQWDEINQSLYYTARLVNQQDITTINNDFCKEEYAKSSQTIIDQLIEVSGCDNIKEIWSIKFHDSIFINVIQEISMEYLYAIDKEKEDSLNRHMNLLNKKLIYGTLHDTYKRTLQKALQSKSKSLRLIGILENFTNDNNEPESKSEELDEIHKSDKENADMFQLNELFSSAPEGTNSLAQLLKERTLQLSSWRNELFGSVPRRTNSLA
ncbi:hypothetical protein C1645_827976 [Glomus cerebriforme]|uniref:Uncharacterized protein n=1 Tax=Glomus cerebriforme TaxID=658196 RepID=A0A397SRR3_9GLOM|nr:hypothetical protein C1645_827976 [Glomus cerebriforme]